MCVLRIGARDYSRYTIFIHDQAYATANINLILRRVGDLLLVCKNSASLSLNIHYSYVTNLGTMTTTIIYTKSVYQPYLELLWSMIKLKTKLKFSKNVNISNFGHSHHIKVI